MHSLQLIDRSLFYFLHPGRQKKDLRHSPAYELFSTSDHWQTYLQWKKSVTLMLDKMPCKIRLLDFSGINDVTAEPLLRKIRSGVAPYWHWESTHYKPKVGETIIASIFGKTSQLLPMQELQPENIDDHIKQQDLEWQAFRSRHGTQLKFAPE